MDELGDSELSEGIGEGECDFIREYDGCSTPSNMLKVLRLGLGDDDFFVKECLQENNLCVPLSIPVLF